MPRSADPLRAPTSRSHALMLWGVHALSAVLLMLLVVNVRLKAPVWALPSERWPFVAGLAATHLLAATILAWRSRRPGRVTLRDAVFSVAAAYGFLSFALLVVTSWYSRVSLLAAVAFSLVSISLAVLSTRRWHAGTLLLGLFFGVGSLSALGSWQALQERPQVQEELISTTFYDVRFVIHRGVTPAEVTGGGLEPLMDGILAVAGDGTLHYVDSDSATGDLDILTLPYLVPVNRDEFVTDIPDRARSHHFRVADILVHEFEGRIELLASHHYWKRDARCFVLRVSAAEAPEELFLAGTADLQWRTIFETDPCLPLKTDPNENPFSGMEIGGRLALLDDRTLFLTVGDMSFDGANSVRILSQDPTAQYGKIIRIDLDSHSAEIYSIGHRNPQGLYVAPDGAIWITEHGPRGGDELNLVEPGRNYGWPLVTYGTEYGELTWPLSNRQGRHDGYEAPVFAWMPAIAASNLIRVSRDLFPAWHGDFLVASLGAGTVFRLRVLDRRVVFAEPIRLARRIRDIQEALDGRIVLLFDDGSIGHLSPVSRTPDDPSSRIVDGSSVGELLFGSCRGCHSTDGSGTSTGPDLHNIVGRRIAASPDFEYSPALTRLSGRWTRERLDEFLAQPQEYAPGNFMVSGGISNAEARASVINYLETLR